MHCHCTLKYFQTVIFWPSRIGTYFLPLKWLKFYNFSLSKSCPYDLRSLCSIFHSFSTVCSNDIVLSPTVKLRFLQFYLFLFLFFMFTLFTLFLSSLFSPPVFFFVEPIFGVGPLSYVFIGLSTYFNFPFFYLIFPWLGT